MPKGLTAFLQMQEQQQAQREVNRVRKLFLTNDNDSARFRFLNPAEEIFVSFFHRVTKPAPSGKLFSGTVLCPDDSVPCSCPIDDEKSKFGRSLQGAIWIWVYDITSSSPMDGDDVQTMKKAGRVVYVKPVGEPRLLMLKTAQLNLLNELDAEYSGITSRDFRYVRHGEKGNMKTTYDFVAAADSTVFTESVDDLPDLETFLIQESEQLLGRKNPGYDAILGRDSTAEMFSYDDKDSGSASIDDADLDF